MQMLSNMKRFQGEAAEVDSGPVRTGMTSLSTATPLLVPDRDKTGNGSPVSSTLSPASLVSVNSSSTSPPNIPGAVGSGNGENSSNSTSSISSLGAGSITGGRQPFLSNGEVGRKENERGDNRVDQRQSALLQVSEAHLAILPDEDGDT